MRVGNEDLDARRNERRTRRKYRSYSEIVDSRRSNGVYLRRG